MSSVSVRYIIDDVPKAIHFYTTFPDSSWSTTLRQLLLPSCATVCDYCSSATAVRGRNHCRTVAVNRRAGGTAFTSR